MCIIVCFNCDCEWDLEKVSGCPICSEDQNNNLITVGESGEWEAYIHSNGTLKVNRMFGNKGVDQSSPFVLRYLGSLPCDSREQAERIFKEKALKKILS